MSGLLELRTTFGHAFVAWLGVSPLLVAALYFGTLPFLRRLSPAPRLPGGTGGVDDRRSPRSIWTERSTLVAVDLPSPLERAPAGLANGLDALVEARGRARARCLQVARRPSDDRGVQGARRHRGRHGLDRQSRRRGRVGVPAPRPASDGLRAGRRFARQARADRRTRRRDPDRRNRPRLRQGRGQALRRRTRAFPSSRTASSRPSTRATAPSPTRSWTPMRRASVGRRRSGRQRRAHRRHRADRSCAARPARSSSASSRRRRR